MPNIEFPRPKSYLGTPIEGNSLYKNPSFYLAIPLVTTWEHLRGATVEAPDDLPRSGPMLFISTHPGRDSSLLLPWAIREATGRLASVVVKRSLIDPNYQESARVLEATGKASIDSEKIPLGKAGTIFVAGARRVGTNFIKNAVDAVPIDRDGVRMSTMKKINQQLRDEKRALGIFLQWTRTPENSLANAMPAAAAIMKSNPDIPVSLMVQRDTKVLEGRKLTRNRPHVLIGEPFHLTDSDFDPDRRMTKEEIHDELLNRTEPLLHRIGLTEIFRPT